MGYVASHHLYFCNESVTVAETIKVIVKGSFEFRITKNRTRVPTKEMADFSAIKYFFLSFEENFLLQLLPIIRHLPSHTYAEVIYEALVKLGFDVISVKQITTSRLSPSQVPENSNLPFFLVSLPRTGKSQDIFKLRSLCHIHIKVEAYKKQNGLTHCLTVRSLAMYGQIVISLPPACGVVAVTCTNIAWEKQTKRPHRHAAIASW
jgi:hypothetical protein